MIDRLGFRLHHATGAAFRKTLGAGRQLAVLKADAAHWLSDSEYVALRLRLQRRMRQQRRRWRRLG